MKKILYFDCFSGISGDMVLAALTGLGVPEQHLAGELAKLGLDGYSISFTPDSRKGIHGLRADVTLTGHPGHDDGHGRHNHHEHRSFTDIVRIIETSTLPERVKSMSIAVFRRVADAEGLIHGIPFDRVTFHEVGAVDSIVDIVGAAICLDYLKPDKIIASPVELGGGFVKCEHGMLPVPAPATLEILKGVPVKSGAVKFETATPTGAAILAGCADEFSESMNFTVKKISYGIGHRDHEIPNVLRVIIADSDETVRIEEKALMLECNIDDMNQEIYGYLTDRLLGAGASDVFYTPIIMKKGRPAVKVSVLVPVPGEDAIARILLSETTTFGYRKTEVGKMALDRRFEKKNTSLGEVRIKSAIMDGRMIKSKPEFDDCRRIAQETGMPLLDVYKRILGEVNE